MNTKKKPSKVRFNALFDAGQYKEAMEYADAQQERFVGYATEWGELANKAYAASCNVWVKENATLDNTSPVSYTERSVDGESTNENDSEIIPH